MAEKQPVPCTVSGERTCRIALKVILFHTFGDKSLYSVATQYIGLPVMARSKAAPATHRYTISKNKRKISTIPQQHGRRGGTGPI